MVLNPWKVQSISDFNYFCCPECVYWSKEEFEFQVHALQNHVLSTTFFHGVENADENHAENQGKDYHFFLKTRVGSRFDTSFVMFRYPS